MNIKHFSQLHAYQNRAVGYLVSRLTGTLRPDAPLASALHLDMSLGKTVITLTALSNLFNRLQIKGVLLLAPRRVAETVWKQEAEKWSHLTHLKICILRGRNKSLLERDLIRPYDIWIANYEALPWLVPVLNKLFLAAGHWLPFDTLVFDEVTRVKNVTGKRVQLLYAQDETGKKFIQHFSHRIGLTGTPAPNGYWDLFGQYFALDDGKTLGDVPDVYAERFFLTDPFTGRRELAPKAKETIQKLIAPMTLTMRSESLELPEYKHNDLWVDLPPKARSQYDQLEKEMFTELDHGSVQVFNAASLTAKCRQMANGMIIDSETNTAHPVHSAKLEALDEVVEEVGGNPLLVSYVYRADMERIRRRYRKLPVGYLGPGVGMAETIRTINTWNQGNLALLLLHHQSGGHGLNLQSGGHQVVWFGLDWPLEGWLQLNARLRRQGQRMKHVIIHRILARNTVDEAILERLTGKEKDQDDLFAALKALQDYRDRRNA